MKSSEPAVLPQGASSARRHELAFLVAGIRIEIANRSSVKLDAVNLAHWADFAVPGRGSAGEDGRLPIRIAGNAQERGGPSRLLCRTRRGLACERSSRGLRLVWAGSSSGTRDEWVAETDLDVSAARLCEAGGCVAAMARPGRGPATIPSPVIQVLLSLHLAARGIGALHHAAAAIRGGRCYLFPARSGTGKSTLATLLDRSGEFRVLGDDRIFTRRRGGEFAGCGTPWVSTAGLCENLSAPLGALVFLNQARQTCLEAIPHADAARRLLPLTDIPWWEPRITDSVLDYLDGLVSTVPAYILHFTPTPDVARALAEALSS